MDDHSANSTLADLFAAVTAHLRGDLADVGAIVESTCPTSGFALPFAAVMAAGEYLRDVAADRDMTAGRLLEILRAAHSLLAEPATSTLEGDILAGVAAYLRGAGELWDGDVLERLAADPLASCVASVRVVSAALAWHARDNGVDPLEAARTTCLAVARSGAPST